MELPDGAHHAGAELRSLLSSINITSTPNSLGGNSLQVVNGSLHFIVFMVLAAVIAGGVVDCLCPLASTSKGSPGAGLIGMLCASYCLLIPGIFFGLFSYNVFVELHFELIMLPFDVAWNLTSQAMTESMYSLIRLLFDSGGWTGGCLVIMYAIILPALKIVLLLVAEGWRHSSNIERRNLACTSIHVVQLVSKWASPDMFAYILLLFLLRNLGHPPEVHSEAALDVGFLCFSVFCVASTLSSLLISPPVALVEAPHKSPAWVRRLQAEMKVQQAAYALAALFFVLLLAGFVVPCMGLRLSVDSLMEPTGAVPEAGRHIVEGLHLEDKVKSEVTLWRATCAMLFWASEGESACAVAFLLLSLFVIAFSTLDVVVLVIAVSQLGDPSKNQGFSTSAFSSLSRASLAPSPVKLFLPTPAEALRTAWVLKHIAMLDVFCMGVVVVCLAGAAYRSMGIVLELRSGIVLLIGAEVAHNILYFLVKNVFTEEEDGDQMRERDLDPADSSPDPDRRTLLATDDPAE